MKYQIVIIPVMALFISYSAMAQSGASKPQLFFIPDSVLTNFDQPAIYGGNHVLDSTYWTALIMYNPVDTAYSVSFIVVGEHSDAYKVCPPVIVPRSSAYQSAYFWMNFSGAPKHLIHDTLVSTYTGDFGTTVTRNPIEAYSAYTGTHTVGALPQIIAPFLGEGTVDLMITNTMAIPIEVDGLHFIGKDSLNYFVAGPSVIQPHDSAAYPITFKDNDQTKDCEYNSRIASLQGNVRPIDGTDLPCLDSILTVNLNGIIDVYCPEYPSYVPDLRHGLHPAGIIFHVYLAPFKIIYSNSDSVTREFYPPYFEDDHFTLSMMGWTLPDTIRPITDWMITETSYTDDALHQSRLTRLRWPRDIDTISIDVLALGFDWQEEVQPSSVPDLIRVWPNPASSFIRIECAENIQDQVRIVDAVGRTVRTFNLDLSHHVISIGDLVEGFYGLEIPSMARVLKFQVVR